jgi:hypothetical protein
MHTQRIMPHLIVNMLVAVTVAVLYYYIPSMPPLPGLIIRASIVSE